MQATEGYEACPFQADLEMAHFLHLDQGWPAGVFRKIPALPLLPGGKSVHLRAAHRPRADSLWQVVEENDHSGVLHLRGFLNLPPIWFLHANWPYLFQDPS